MSAPTRAMQRVVGTWAIVVLVAAAASLFVVDRDDGPFDRAAAEACGRRLARHVGLTPVAAAGRLEGDRWRISVVTETGTLLFAIRRDGLVLEAARVLPGGEEALDREDRLAIFERGC